MMITVEMKVEGDEGQYTLMLQLRLLEHAD